MAYGTAPGGRRRNLLLAAGVSVVLVVAITLAVLGGQVSSPIQGSEIVAY